MNVVSDQKRGRDWRGRLTNPAWHAETTRSHDIELHETGLILHSTVKGGDYIARELRDPMVRHALIDYLNTCGRMHVIGKTLPVWTRHDYAGDSGLSLTSHAFVQNLKRYAKQAGINNIHLHQMRHTFARMVSEDSGSIAETQDALGHRHIATTKVYVQRIAVRRDKYSESILKRFEDKGSGRNESGNDL